MRPVPPRQVHVTSTVLRAAFMIDAICRTSRNGLMGLDTPAIAAPHMAMTASGSSGASTDTTDGPVRHRPKQAGRRLHAADKRAIGEGFDLVVRAGVPHEADRRLLGLDGRGRRQRATNRPGRHQPREPFPFDRAPRLDAAQRDAQDI